MNLFALVSANAAAYPDKTAIIHEGKALSYRAFTALVADVAALLRSRGILPGDRVGLLSRNCPEYIILSFALLRLEAAIVPISEKLRFDEVREIIDGVAVTALVVQGTTPLIPDGNGETFPFGEQEFLLYRFPDNRDRPCGVLAQPPAFIRFTSGTTAHSKGVVLSHLTIAERTAASNKVLHLTSADTIIWMLPMSYHFAVSIVLYLIVGATIVLAEDHMGDALLEDILTNKGTFLYGSPVHYRLLAQAKGTEQIPTVRLAISTTADLPESVFDAFLRRFSLPLSQCYGIIEVGLPAINTLKPLEKRRSVGLPPPDYRVRIVDPETGSECAAGAAGTIMVQGPGILDAYWDPFKTRDEILKDGWFCTGDSGFLDEEGYLTISGRLSGAINMGGLKFYPQEVEAVLNAHPAVEESRVYGFRHQRFGELPAAEVVCRAGASVTEDELLDFCRERLASFKLPFSVSFVGEIPKTASGKIRRG